MESQQTAIDLIEEKLNSQSEIPSALKPIIDDVDADVQLGFTEKPNHGSKYYTPYTKQVGNKRTDNDGCEAGDPWFCRVNNPIIESEATANDRKARNLEEVLPPAKDFYSVAKSYPGAKQQHRNYMVVINFIFTNKGDNDKLRKAWNRFWVRWNQEGLSWMSPNHMKAVRGTFHNMGISKAS